LPGSGLLAWLVFEWLAVLAQEDRAMLWVKLKFPELAIAVSSASGPVGMRALAAVVGRRYASGVKACADHLATSSLLHTASWARL